VFGFEHEPPCLVFDTAPLVPPSRGRTVENVEMLKGGKREKHTEKCAIFNMAPSGRCFWGTEVLKMLKC
jgi:hypothetical protein